MTRAAALAILALAVWETARLARADLAYREGTASSVEEATRADPANARYRRAQGELIERHHGDPRPAYRAATSLDPRNADGWIRLGLAEEAAGDLAAAEAALVKAAGVSRKFAPRWTLAAFHERRGRENESRRWARSALEVPHSNPTAVFDLYHRLDASLMQAAKDLPPSRDTRIALVYYALGKRADEAAERFALDLARTGTPKETTFYLDVADDRIRWGRFSAAADVWDAARERGAIHAEPDGRAEGTGRGFDWRGGAAFRRPGLDGWWIALDGRQEDQARMVERLARVKESARYEFAWRISGEIAGLRWRVTEAAPAGTSERELAAPVAGHGEGKAEFTTPAGAQAVRLALVYERPRGQARVEGRARLEFAELRAK